MPLALVVVAAKQAQPWIAQCVSSALAQVGPPGWRIGVVVGVDCCPSTAQALGKVSDPRLAVRYFPRHVGPYVIFNSLACTSTADVLLRFDADDVMLPGYIAKQLARLDAPLSPAVVQTWSVFVDPWLRPCSAELADGSRTNLDGKRMQASHGQFLITRSVLQRLGSCQPWPCHADTEFLQRARWSGIRMELVPEHLYFRRVHPKSLTAAAGTGYRSQLRGRLAALVKASGERYAWGESPERLHPLIAPFQPAP
jgi:glycosyltransferase involved in cell wall biosynthesis